MVKGFPPSPQKILTTPLKYKLWQLHSEHYVTVMWACVGVRWEGAETWSSGTHASYQRRCWGGNPERMGGSQHDLLSRLSHLHPHGCACLSGSKETSSDAHWQPLTRGAFTEQGLVLAVRDKHPTLVYYQPALFSSSSFSLLFLAGTGFLGYWL